MIDINLPNVERIKQSRISHIIYKSYVNIVIWPVWKNPIEKLILFTTFLNAYHFISFGLVISCHTSYVINISCSFVWHYWFLCVDVVIDTAPELTFIAQMLAEFKIPKNLQAYVLANKVVLIFYFKKIGYFVLKRWRFNSKIQSPTDWIIICLKHLTSKYVIRTK